MAESAQPHRQTGHHQMPRSVRRLMMPKGRWRCLALAKGLVAGSGVQRRDSLAALAASEQYQVCSAFPPLGQLCMRQPTVEKLLVQAAMEAVD
jgi:hypothetical protein